jgi:DNA-directed RNA polymerase subunit L
MLLHNFLRIMGISACDMIDHTSHTRQKRMFRVDLDATTKDRVSFVAHDMPLSFVNALRRAIVADVPNVAIRFDPSAPPPTSGSPEITFKVNTCGMHNEQVGQRISMMPLHFRAEEIDVFQASAYRFVLHAHNVGPKPLHVTARDVAMLDAEGRPVAQEMRDRVLARDVLLLTLAPNPHDLKAGEEVHLEARASVGTASQWAGYAVARFPCFGFVKDDALVQERLAELVAGMTPEEAARATTDFHALDAQRCYAKDEEGDPKGGVAMTVESICGLTAAQVVARAIAAVLGRLRSLAAGRTVVKVSPCGPVPDMVYATLEGESHTLGSMLQQHVLEVEKEAVRYVGYVSPFRDTVVLKVQFATEEGAAGTEAFLRRVAQDLGERVMKWTAAWDRASHEAEGA